MATWAAKPFETYVAALRDGDIRARRQAAAALQIQGDQRAVDPLIAALADDSPDVRAIVARALGALGDPRAVDPLSEALDDPLPEVRAEIIRALRRLGDRRAVEAFIRALRDPEWGIRQIAAGALGDMGDARAVGPLLRAFMEEDEDIISRGTIAIALGALGGPAVRPLIGALDRGDSATRALAALALVYPDEPRAVDALHAALTDEDSVVRGFASWALENRDTR